MEFLKNELKCIEKYNQDGQLSIRRGKNSKRSRHRFRKLNDLKFAFSEFYLMLIFLKDYQTLNYTGFWKILKKHDRLFQTTRGNEWRYRNLFFSFILRIYLGLSKSSDGGTFFSYRKFEKLFFFHQQIERHSLYLSMLIDHYSTNVMIIKFR